MIILKEKFYISQELQDWAKKERMRRDWERMERESIRDNFVSQLRRAATEGEEASAALHNLDDGKYEEDNKLFKKSFHPKNTNVHFDDDSSGFSKDLSYEPSISNEEFIKRKEGVLEYEKKTERDYEKALKKLKRLGSVLDKTPYYSYLDDGKTTLPIPDRPQFLRRAKGTSMTPEELKKFKEYIAGRTHYRNAKLNVAPGYELDELIDKYKTPSKVKIAHSEDSLNFQREEVRRLEEELNKIKEGSLGNRQYKITLNKNGYQRADGRHEEGHMLNLINRDFLKNDPNTPKYSNGNVIQIPKFKDKDGKKYLENLIAMLDNGAEDKDQRGKFGLGKKSLFEDLGPNISTKELRDLIENRENRLSPLAKERLDVVLKLVKEEDDASHKGWINNYLDPTTTEKDWIATGKSNKLAGDTYRAGINNANGSLGNEVSMINTNLNINSHKLKVLEKIEDDLIEKLAKEGKSREEITQRVKKFRQHHGRLGGFINTSDLIDKVADFFRHHRK